MSRTTPRRVALVTGASRGIGRAVAAELARRGDHVLALARTQGALEALDDEVARDEAARGAGGTVSLIPADLTDEHALGALPGALASRSTYSSMRNFSAAPSTRSTPSISAISRGLSWA